MAKNPDREETDDSSGPGSAEKGGASGDTDGVEKNIKVTRLMR
jgi:hypothetical protein